MSFDILCKKLLSDLLILQARVKDDPEAFNVGSICTMVLGDLDYEEAFRMTRFLAIMWKKWPEFSGNMLYPVTAGNLNPVFAFDQALTDEQMWVGEYGAARRRLLDWLIIELQS